MAEPAMREHVILRDGAWVAAKPDILAERRFLAARADWFTWREAADVELASGSFLAESGLEVRPGRLLGTIEAARSQGFRFHPPQPLPSIEPRSKLFSFHHRAPALLVDKAELNRASPSGGGASQPQSTELDALLLEHAVAARRPERHPDAVAGGASTGVREELALDEFPLRSSRQIQRQLAALHAQGQLAVSPGADDGDLSHSRRALAAFQAQHKIEETGLPDPKTRRLLAAPLQGAGGQTPPEPEPPVLRALHWDRLHAWQTATQAELWATVSGVPDGEPLFAEILGPDGDALELLESKVEKGKARFSARPALFAGKADSFRVRLLGKDARNGQPLRTSPSRHALGLIPEPLCRGSKLPARLAQAALDLHRQKPRRLTGPLAAANLVVEVYASVVGEALLKGVLGETPPRGERLEPFPPSLFYFKDVVDLEIRGRFTQRERKIGFLRQKSRFDAIHKRLSHRRLEDGLKGIELGNLLVWPVESPERRGQMAIVVDLDPQEQFLIYVGADPERGAIRGRLTAAEAVDHAIRAWRNV